MPFPRKVGGVPIRRLPWHVWYVSGARLASTVRKLQVQLTHRHCTVRFEGPVYLGPGFALHIPERGTLIIGPGVSFRRDFYCEIAGDGRVEIGAGTTFTGTAMIQCATSIVIGTRCAFGQATQIVDGSHNFRDWTRHWSEQGDSNRPIVVGDGALVHSKCTVINDIGDGAIIGANAVVSRPVPAYCVAVGTPARVVEYFGPPDRRPAGLVIEEHVSVT
jgi:acetyltransferase-like isoleucine patch superfamily enzyme